MGLWDEIFAANLNKGKQPTTKQKSYGYRVDGTPKGNGFLGQKQTAVMQPDDISQSLVLGTEGYSQMSKDTIEDPTALVEEEVPLDIMPLQDQGKMPTDPIAGIMPKVSILSKGGKLSKLDEASAKIIVDEWNRASHVVNGRKKAVVDVDMDADKDEAFSVSIEDDKEVQETIGSPSQGIFSGTAGAIATPSPRKDTPKRVRDVAKDPMGDIFNQIKKQSDERSAQAQMQTGMPSTDEEYQDRIDPTSNKEQFFLGTRFGRAMTQGYFGWTGLMKGLGAAPSVFAGDVETAMDKRESMMEDDTSGSMVRSPEDATSPIDELSKGNIGRAMAAGGWGLIEQAPILGTFAVAAFTGPVGTAAVAAAMGLGEQTSTALKRDPRATDAGGKIAVGAMAQAALDTVGFSKVTRSIGLMKKVGNSFLKTVRTTPVLRRWVQDIVASGNREGVTEGLQEFINIAVAIWADKEKSLISKEGLNELFSPENLKQYGDAAIIGAMSGGAMEAGPSAINAYDDRSTLNQLKGKRSLTPIAQDEEGNPVYGVSKEGQLENKPDPDLEAQVKYQESQKRSSQMREAATDTINALTEEGLTDVKDRPKNNFTLQDVIDGNVSVPGLTADNAQSFMEDHGIPADTDPKMITIPGYYMPGEVYSVKRGDGGVAITGKGTIQLAATANPATAIEEAFHANHDLLSEEEKSNLEDQLEQYEKENGKKSEGSTSERLAYMAQLALVEDGVYKKLGYRLRQFVDRMRVVFRKMLKDAHDFRKEVREGKADPDFARNLKEITYSQASKGMKGIKTNAEQFLAMIENRIDERLNDLARRITENPEEMLEDVASEEMLKNISPEQSETPAVEEVDAENRRGNSVKQAPAKKKPGKKKKALKTPQIAPESKSTKDTTQKTKEEVKVKPEATGKAEIPGQTKIPAVFKKMPVSTLKEQAKHGVKGAIDELVFRASKKNEPEKMTEEEYLTSKGATRMKGAEPALHRTPGGFPKGVREKHLAKVQKDMQDNSKRRQELRQEYSEKVASGEIVTPSREEQLIKTANGHEDLESTQAARRLLEKRGVEWRETTTEQEPFAAKTTPAEEPPSRVAKPGASIVMSEDMKQDFREHGVSEDQISRMASNDTWKAEGGISTGQPVVLIGYNGKGRTNWKEVYGPDADGPIFGNGLYLATSKERARVYGDDVVIHIARFANPFVLKNDEQLSELFDQNVPHDNKSRIPLLKKARTELERRGHDGVIILVNNNSDMDSDKKSFKRLREIAGHSQAIIFDKKKTPGKKKSAQIAAKTTPVEEPIPATTEAKAVFSPEVSRKIRDFNENTYEDMTYNQLANASRRVNALIKSNPKAKNSLKPALATIKAQRAIQYANHKKLKAVEKEILEHPLYVALLYDLTAKLDSFPDTGVKLDKEYKGELKSFLEGRPYLKGRIRIANPGEKKTVWDQLMTDYKRVGDDDTAKDSDVNEFLETFDLSVRIFGSKTTVIDYVLEQAIKTGEPGIEWLAIKRDMIRKGFDNEEIELAEQEHGKYYESREGQESEDIYEERDEISDEAQEDESEWIVKEDDDFSDFFDFSDGFDASHIAPPPKPEEATGVTLVSTKYDAGNSAKTGQQLGLLGEASRKGTVGLQSTMQFTEPSKLDQEIKNEKVEDIEGQQKLFNTKKKSPGKKAQAKSINKEGAIVFKPKFRSDQWVDRELNNIAPGPSSKPVVLVAYRGSEDNAKFNDPYYTTSKKLSNTTSDKQEVRLENPYVLTNDTQLKNLVDIPSPKNIRKILIRMGHDSVVISLEEGVTSKVLKETVGNSQAVVFEKTDMEVAASAELSMEIMDAPPVMKRVQEHREAEAKPKQRKIKKKVSRAFSEIGKGASELITPISSVLGRIHPSLKRALRMFEDNYRTAWHNDLNTIHPFLETYEKLDEMDKAEMDLALKNANADPEALQQLLIDHDMESQYTSVRRVLDDLYQRTRDAGIEVGYLENHFPRVVNDISGLRDYLHDGEYWSIIQIAIDKHNKKLPQPMTAFEERQFVNEMLRGYGENRLALGGNSPVKGRLIKSLTPEMNEFYSDAISGLTAYIMRMNETVEARRFFGKGTTDDDPIGTYVLALVKRGIIEPTEEERVRSVLQARFTSSTPEGIWRTYRNIEYTETLNNAITALTQLDDLGLAWYRGGFVTGLPKAILNAVKSAFNKSEIKLSMIGLENIVLEMQTSEGSSAMMDWAFKWSGLKYADRIGKETLLNTIYQSYRNDAKSGKFSRKNLKRIIEVFGKEPASLIQDFKDGKFTDDMRYLLFNEIMDAHPVALSEMPQKYLEMRNGKIIYMLKTYMLKRVDIIRREGIDLILNGKGMERIDGLMRLTTLAACLIMAGMGVDEAKDLVLGRKTDMNDRVTDNIFKTIGLSKYTIYRARTEGITKSALTMVAPPFRMIDSAFFDVRDLWTGKFKGSRLIQSVPIGGKFYYWWWGRGSKNAAITDREITIAKAEKLLRSGKKKQVESLLKDFNSNYPGSRLSISTVRQAKDRKDRKDDQTREDIREGMYPSDMIDYFNN